jgi:hypothetical protein
MTVATGLTPVSIRAVTLAETQPSAFWSEAQSLFDELCELAERLRLSPEVTDEVARKVVAVAERIPDSPDDLSAMDPYLRASLLTAVVHAQAAAVKRERGRLVVEVERARQALRDIVDEHAVWRGGPRDAARWLVEDARIGRADVEELLDISSTTLRRWLDEREPTEPSPEASQRAMVVAKIVNHLRHAMTPRGVAMWLREPHPLLDDRTPLEELKDARSYQSLVHLAAGSRSAGAT